MNEAERKLQGTTSDDVTVPIKKKKPILPPDFLSRFEIINLSLTCEALSQINLPIFAGSAFRGIFGRALKDLACVARNTPCPECPSKERCAYPGVFEIQGNPSLPIYQKVSDLPRPFVLEPPTDSKIAPGQNFEVRLYLFGNAINHYPWVIQAFARVGSRGVGFGRGKYKVKRAVEAPGRQLGELFLDITTRLGEIAAKELKATAKAFPIKGKDGSLFESKDRPSGLLPKHVPLGLKTKQMKDAPNIAPNHDID